MPITRLNHAVLYVRDAEASAALLRRCRSASALSRRCREQSSSRPRGRRTTMTSVCSLSGVDAGLSEAGRRTVGLYHLAWEVDTLDELERIAGVLSERGALVGASDHGTTKALYARDPDGIEFEVSWLVPADLIDTETEAAKATIKPLDIAREKARYGAATRGGVGVSTPV